jgi:hypothetical protein
MKSKTFLASILQHLQNVEANFFTQFLKKILIFDTWTGRRNTIRRYRYRLDWRVYRWIARELAHPRCELWPYWKHHCGYHWRVSLHLALALGNTRKNTLIKTAKRSPKRKAGPRTYLGPALRFVME